MKTPYQRGLALLVLAGVPYGAPLEAQASGTIRGQVSSAQQPVADVALHLRAATSPQEQGASRYVLTDNRGHFLIADVPRGAWILEARRVTYIPSIERVTVQVGETTTVSVVLRPLAQPLDTIDVVQRSLVPERYGASSRMHEFYRRRARARGRFFTREDIEASGRAKLTDLLRFVPGARVKTYPGNRAEVAFARCTGPVQLARSGSLTAVARGETGSRGGTVGLYVNGVRIDTVSAQQTLAEFDLGEIEAIEVYRGVSELPPEALGDACAAIFVWTRFGPGEDASLNTSPQRPEAELRDRAAELH